MISEKLLLFQRRNRHAISDSRTIRLFGEDADFERIKVWYIDVWEEGGGGGVHKYSHRIPAKTLDIQENEYMPPIRRQLSDRKSCLSADWMVQYCHTV